MSAPIFISFASKDLSVANTICEALENRGFHCWISSRDIGPGENFQVAIVRAIRLAKAMILVFSGHSNISEEVKKELVLAGQSKLVVIPLRVEDVAPDEAFAYEFATRQWIDAFHDWEHAIQRVVDQLLLVEGLRDTRDNLSARSDLPQESRKPPPLTVEKQSGSDGTPSPSVNARTTRLARDWRLIAFPAFGLAALAIAAVASFSIFSPAPSVRGPGAETDMTPPRAANPSGRSPAEVAVKPSSSGAPVQSPQSRSASEIVANPPSRSADTATLPPQRGTASTPAAGPAGAAQAGTTLNPRIADIGIGEQRKSPGSELLGAWGGSSRCPQGEIGIELLLKEAKADGAVLGSLRFFNPPGQNLTEEGEYAVQGRYYDKDRTLYLRPGEWIKQPPGYSMANFTAALSLNEQTLTGRVSNGRCYTISVTREGGSPSLPSAPLRPSE
jgi:hypothetical protein